jgi:hypothetical protein
MVAMATKFVSSVSKGVCMEKERATREETPEPTKDKVLINCEVIHCIACASPKVPQPKEAVLVDFGDGFFACECSAQCTKEHAIAQGFAIYPDIEVDVYPIIETLGNVPHHTHLGYSIHLVDPTDKATLDAAVEADIERRQTAR